MASLLERAVYSHLDVYTRSPEFKSMLARLIKWSVQGYERGFGPDGRKAFTATVANRIHRKARCGRATLFGFKLWRKRYPYSWCEETAERIVTDWLRDEQMKFGDQRFNWSDGRDIADEEMSHWERAA